MARQEQVFPESVEAPTCAADAIKAITTAAGLRQFWEQERANPDAGAAGFHLECFAVSWDIMRRLSNEVGLDVLPEPNLGDPLDCTAAALMGRPISVDDNLVRNTIDEIIAWCRKAEAGGVPLNRGGGDNDPRQLTPEARAILFIQERIKTTGKVPTKTAIAKALEVNRRTLNNWSAFKVAYKKLQSDNRRQPARGTKAKDGTLEAWRESGK